MTAVFEVIGISPLDRPDPGLVAAACDAGALGVLDLGRDPAEAARALAALARRLPGGFGVRVPEGASVPELPPQAHTVIVESVADLARFADHRVYVQVTSEAEARAAIAARKDKRDGCWPMHCAPSNAIRKRAKWRASHS